jgi:hypothetical protein
LRLPVALTVLQAVYAVKAGAGRPVRRPSPVADLLVGWLTGSDDA